MDPEETPQEKSNWLKALHILSPSPPRSSPLSPGADNLIEATITEGVFKGEHITIQFGKTTMESKILLNGRQLSNVQSLTIYGSVDNGVWNVNLNMNELIDGGP
jgi:hypothetical protein